MAETRVVAVGSIVTCSVESPWHTRKMKEVLQKQGQIEPLQVREHGVNYKTFEEDVHATDIVCAAEALRWPTLLVCVAERYIR